MFGTDQVLLYDVDPWGEIGFGVPNFANKTQTTNRHLWRLADEIGTLQLYIMTHVDTLRDDPPSRNTIERIGKLTNRVQAILQGRTTPLNENRTEPGHSQPAPRAWNIHPVPYFPGPIVKNGWLAEYNEYCMMALANIMQHTENDLALTITPAAAGDIWQYFKQIRNMLAFELIGLSQDVVTDTFQFNETHYSQYDPYKVTVRTESMNEPVDPRVRFTEIDLRPLVQGIPANLILPNLSRYPHSTSALNYEGAKQDAKNPNDTVAGGTQAFDPVI